MSLKELIRLASEKSPEFSKKYNYWIGYRRKAPELQWLMDELTQVLGTSFMEQSAREEIANGEVREAGAADQVQA